jgi:hypothetical protein
MSQCQEVTRNDTSDVPRYLPIILEGLANGIPLTTQIKKNKKLPKRATIHLWIHRQADDVRQAILNKMKECRELGVEALEDEAFELAMSDIYDTEDAKIKLMRVKMLIDVANRIKPRNFVNQSSSFFEQNSKPGNTEPEKETLVPSMTAELARQLLKQKRS